MPAAVAEAAPPDDPPGVRDGSRGFSVCPCSAFRQNQRSENAGVIRFYERHGYSVGAVTNLGKWLIDNPNLPPTS